jgi:hypothetical protein
MIDRKHDLPISAQAKLLGLSRGTVKRCKSATFAIERFQHFFGFGPAPAEEPEVLETPIEAPVQAPVEASIIVPAQEKEASAVVAPAPTERPKKRRRRRKKKAVPAGGVSALNGGGAPPAPAEPGPSEAMPDKPA